MRSETAGTPNSTSFTSLVERIRQTVPSVVGIYLFGSGARDALRSDSDLDLGLVLPPEYHFSDRSRIELAGILAEDAGRTVDLVVLDPTASAVLCMEAVSTGRLVFVGDADAMARFEMRSLREYARLREDRRPVIAAYSVSGDNG